MTTAVFDHHLPHRTPTELLNLARRGLDQAAHTPSAGHRYAAAHLAALRAAAAVLAAKASPARSTPADRRRPSPSVWVLLPQVAPEFTDWAGFFDGAGERRAAAEAGLPRAVSAADADELVRAAEQFVAVAETAVAR